ncbi:hypothetical protein BGX23_012345 [Mortierella sp. AD031]|nr:hypothetical protein BGX23_012345 [Mortierella sp. AD031]
MNTTPATNSVSSVGLSDIRERFPSSAFGRNYAKDYSEVTAAATTVQDNNSNSSNITPDSPQGGVPPKTADDSMGNSDVDDLIVLEETMELSFSAPVATASTIQDNISSAASPPRLKDSMPLPSGAPTTAANTIQYSNSSAAGPALSTAYVPSLVLPMARLPLAPVTSYESGVAANTTQVNNSSTAISVVFMGNPGVGKSALLNALGGHFSSGYSEIQGLTRGVTSQQVVTTDGRLLRLFDVPGIYDVAEEGGTVTIVKHLQMLQETLNSGGQFVLFFVIRPRNGRVEPTDYMIMKTVLDSLKEAPMVGMILTQVRMKHLPQIQTEEYWGMLLEPLQTIDEGNESRSRQFLSTRSPLVLANHGKEGFSEKERSIISKYVLSFPPQPVVARSMTHSMERQHSDMMKQGMSEEPHSENF